MIFNDATTIFTIKKCIANYLPMVPLPIHALTLLAGINFFLALQLKIDTI